MLSEISPPSYSSMKSYQASDPSYILNHGVPGIGEPKTTEIWNPNIPAAL